MVLATSPDNQSVDYRYFVVDIMSNELLAEIPFKSVSWSRTLNEAGSFSGDIAVTEDTYNLSLYENTLPAKTSLYIVRNGVCVWGGIIWGRTYSLIDKVLSISALEFTSYFSHRAVWKTWNSNYEATAEISSGTGTITLLLGQYPFQEGESVWLDFGLERAKYNGYFSVNSTYDTVDDRSVIVVDAEYVDQSGQTRTIPDMVLEEDDTITVETRQDMSIYVADLLNELKTDLFDFDFANDAIRPGIDLFNEIDWISRSSNIATVQTLKKHELVPGQKIAISDTGVSGFDVAEGIVLAVVDDYSFTYENDGSNVSQTSLTTTTKTVTQFSRSANIATYKTSSAHGFSDGDIVFIENVSETFDGYFTVYGTPPSSTEFRVVMYGVNIATSFTDTTVSSALPKVHKRGSLTYGTFGEFSTLGDIGFGDISVDVGLQTLAENPVIRGYELKTVAEILDDYSSRPGGFDYRIDCSYDSDNNQFSKTLTIIGMTPTSLYTWLAEQESGYSGPIPASAYGADSIIFEYPGNILEAQFEENAEEAATRFFVQGKDSRLSSDASQPYSAASNHKLLRQGWPILDAVENYDSDDETVLWKHASKLLEESVPPISTFTVSVNGSANPTLGSYNPGDWCSVKLNDDFVTLRADSYLEQDYGTDAGVLVRKIHTVSVTVPDTPSYPEEVQLELITEPSIPISGVTIIDGKAFNGD